MNEWTEFHPCCGNEIVKMLKIIEKRAIHHGKPIIDRPKIWTNAKIES